MDRVDMKRVQVLDAMETLHGGSAPPELRAEHVMSLDVSCVHVNTSVVELVRLFHAKNFRHLPIIDDAGQLQGIVSDRDVLRCLGPGTTDKDRLSKTMARDLMSVDLVTIPPQTPVDRAIGLMIDQGISCLPVVEGGQLLGILTNTDLHVLLQTLLQAMRLTSASKTIAAPTR